MLSAHTRIPTRTRFKRRSTAGYLGCCLFLLAALPTAGRAQDWRTVSEKDGVKMEARSIQGERFDQLRVSTSLEISPTVVADYLLGGYLDQRNKNISRTFVKRDRETAIWSDILKVPMISERCYSMRFERQTHASGEIRVKFASIDFIGTKPRPDCIALRSRGEWVMTPVGAGTRLIYASLTDIGGKVPASLARRSLSAAAVSSVRKVAAGASGLPPPPGIGD